MKTGLLQRSMVLAVLMVSILEGLPLVAHGQSIEGRDINERIATITKSLEESQVKLRQYEWFETIVVTVKDEQKMRQQDRCYYGEDGVLQKVIVSASEAPKRKLGLRGRIARKKQAEMIEFMQGAIDMIPLYLPPDSKRIEKVKGNGGVSFTILKPGERVRIDFHNYRLPHDTLGIELDMKTNRLVRLDISSYVGTPEDAFTCYAKFASLNDGTTYLKETVLEAQAKNLRASVKNTGYRKMASASNN